MTTTTEQDSDRNKTNTTSTSKATMSMKESIPTPSIYPTGRLAKQELRNQLLNTKDPRKTISNFQKSHCLHSFLAKAFHTTSIYSDTTTDATTTTTTISNTNSTRQSKALAKSQEKDGVIIEPLQPDSVLTFLKHLNLSHYEVHKHIMEALRSALQDEISRTDEKNNRDALLNLLQSSWLFIHNSDIRPIIISLLKKLGDGIPKEVLVTLSKKQKKMKIDSSSTTTTAAAATNTATTTNQDNVVATAATTDTNSTTSDLVYAELLSQFGLNLKQLVWEAAWDTIIRGDGFPVTDTPSSLSSTTATSDHYYNNHDIGTLQSDHIFIDVIKPLVEDYINDESLRLNANLSFPGTIRDKRLLTQNRRSNTTAAHNISNPNSSSTTGTVPTSSSTKTTSIIPGMLSAYTSSALTGIKPITTSSTTEHSSTSTTTAATTVPSSADALTKLNEVISSRPKLLAAILNILIAEHGNHFKLDNKNNNNTNDHDNRKGDSNHTLNPNSVFGGASYLHCSLVADILLSYTPLPRPYEHVHILALVLDKCVQTGIVSDQALAQIQGCLKVIFQTTDTTTTTKGTTTDVTPAANITKAADLTQTKETSTKIDIDKPPSTTLSASKKNDKSSSSSFSKGPPSDHQYEVKIVRKVILEAVRAMKDCDHKFLFLNPVTDDIAPNYTSVIQKPICIRDIEDKAMNDEYRSLEEYRDDVLLMFQNCITYNIGKEGLWFRSEAKRQQKIWKDEIFKQAEKLLKNQLVKRKKALANTKAESSEKMIENEKKRKREALLHEQERLAKKLVSSNKSNSAIEDTSKSGPSNNEDGDNVIQKLTPDDVAPLPATRTKKRKKDTDFPSMPAIASMLLSDPFVVRLLLDKVIRAIENDVLQQKTIPASHNTIPSLLQILYISQFSTQVCAIKGKKTVIPNSGIAVPSSEMGNDDVLSDLPFSTLRKFTPLLGKLVLEVELDRRLTLRGDLYQIAKDLIPSRTKVDDVREWEGSSSVHMLKDLVQGALISLLQPGRSNEHALLIQYPRFMTVLNKVSNGNMQHEKSFFLSLMNVLRRYKDKLPHSIRDLVLEHWLSWFQCLSGASAMTAPVHECFLKLLIEWSDLGNKLLPSDVFLSFAEKATQHAGTCKSGDVETASFAYYWTKENDNDDFSTIKSLYERLLKDVPERRLMEWRESVGIPASKKRETTLE